MADRYQAESNEFWRGEAARAYQERKQQVWASYRENGVLPWMRHQVSECDLPFAALREEKP